MSWSSEPSRDDTGSESVQSSAVMVVVAWNGCSGVRWKKRSKHSVSGLLDRRGCGRRRGDGVAARVEERAEGKGTDEQVNDEEKSEAVAVLCRHKEKERGEGKKDNASVFYSQLRYELRYQLRSARARRRLSKQELVGGLRVATRQVVLGRTIVQHRDELSGGEKMKLLQQKCDGPRHQR